MLKLKTKHYRYLIVVIIIALLLPAYGMIQGMVADEKVKATPAVYQLSTQDKEIVNDISNMTGVKAEAGLDADYIKKLKDEGFDNNRIIEARVLLERVTSQLRQILDWDNGAPAVPSAGLDLSGTNKQDDISAFKELADKIDVKTAVYLLLKLEKEFGSMERVFDEYLLSLQIGIDLGKYIVDKKAYEKNKSEQSAKFDMSKIITMETIEAKVLELLQDENSSRSKALEAAADKLPDVNNAINGAGGDNTLPLSPLPDVQNPRPKNPQEDVMREIDDLKNKSFGIEGR